MQYRHDDTIAAWDLMNEPHTTDNFESQPRTSTAATHCADAAQAPGTLVRDWLCHMSAFVRAHDSHHLITSGAMWYWNVTCYASVSPGVCLRSLAARGG